MRNQSITLAEWFYKLSQLHRNIPTDFITGQIYKRSIQTYNGKRVVYGFGRVLLFEACEYCGNTSLDDRDLCTACGAPALRDFYALGG